ncbi:uncharacterized protein KD926_001263 [Aspergillus affinis]|uniref:uncharacterized protein n=1 Tax=Aspergillus affinis TaxID=1070780 RepID=UPI0022FEA943|nr:uncharacterized protein KD926_001263 [Aspergillus affinis]KAI9036808.1 integral membrane protein [Aspergillus affinis]
MAVTVPNEGSATSIELAPMPAGAISADASKITLTAPKSDEALREVEEERRAVSTQITAIVITCVTFSTGIQSFLAGLVTITIPTVAVDLSLPDNLVLWPVTIYSLTCGCTLLACGSISDVVGNRQTYLLGCLLQTAFTLGCGLSTTGAQLIVFRGFSGVAASFCLPSAVSLINEVFPTGRSRNISFAAMGGAQPVGFGLGLTLGGIIAAKIGWQWGFHAAAIINFVMLFLAAWQLPRNEYPSARVIGQRLLNDIDWVGVIIASTSLAILSYVIAAIAGSPTAIRSPTNISLLILSFIVLAIFVLWVGRQERLNRPALIPNSLWRHKVFSCICINVFCVWAAFNAFEQFQNFFFQEIQHISPFDSALRFLPMPVAGALANILVGLIVHRVRADWIVIITLIPSAIAPLLMALASPKWPYWSCAFIANFLNPIGADGIFTVSNLLITSMFPPKTQGVAGGVFNTVSQTGKSVGIALTALVANGVTQKSGKGGADETGALLEGYRAAFWFEFALTVASLGVSIWGLGRIGKVGRKMD